MSDDLDDTIAELILLWPALPTALPRDAGVQTGERVTTSENVHSIPLNADVAAVITDLTRQIPEWVTWVAEATSGYATRSILGQLGQIPGFHHDLLQHGRTRDAERLATAAHSWLHRCRTALGLNRADRPIGEPCPNHDDPTTPLIQPGDTGHLRYTKLDANGHPIDAYIEWRRLEIVCCRHCDAVWTPSRYMLLGRLIRHANHQRQNTDRAGDAA